MQEMICVLRQSRAHHLYRNSACRMIGRGQGDQNAKGHSLSFNILGEAVAKTDDGKGYCNTGGRFHEGPGAKTWTLEVYPSLTCSIIVSRWNFANVES